MFSNSCHLTLHTSLPGKGQQRGHKMNLKGLRRICRIGKDKHTSATHKNVFSSDMRSHADNVSFKGAIW